MIQSDRRREDPSATPSRSSRAGESFGSARHVALAAFWFGLFFHWTPILAVLIPYQVIHLLPRSQQGTGIAVVTGLGAVFAVVLPPLVGAWSDRLHTRWGRRRPIMVAGTLVNAAGLLVLMTAGSYGTLLVGYLVIQIANNAAGAAYNGIVPDVVPPREFGRASGMLGAGVQLGSIAGLIGTLLMSAIFHHIEWTYGLMALVIAASLVPTLWAARGEGMAPSAPVLAERETARVIVARFLGPLARGDFAWVVYTRTLITAGIYCVLPFLQLFFRDVIGVRDAADFTAEWELVLLVAATPFGLLGGWLSDRSGRKPFVYMSGALMTLVVVGFVLLAPTQTGVVLFAGALFGIGYGLYYAVDWALACDTLPDRTAAAKDMGLFHVAFTLPQVFVPFVAGLSLDALNRRSAEAGYRAIFIGAAVFYVLGTVFVSRVRSVR